MPQGGRSGDDDYEWLYGKARPGQAPGPGADAHDNPDATRMLPVTPRPGQSPPPPASPPPSTPPSSPAPAAARRRRRRGPRLRWLAWAVLAWLVFLVAVPVYAWTTVSTVDATPAGERPPEQPGSTYLVVGSDARAGLGGQRTDTIMLLHTGSGPNLLMSVPRDSILDIPGHGSGKVNAAFAFGGAPLLVQTLEQATGIRIDHYLEMGFTGLVELVDAVGGIRICPETAMNDPQAQLAIEAGCQQADGETALGYARSRKTQQLGDIDRARHQREVVGAIGTEVLAWQTVVNPVRYWRVTRAGASVVTVSADTGPIAAARFVLGMTRTDGERGLTCAVPIRDLEVNWDRERADRLFALIAEDRTDQVGDDLCRPSGLPE